VLGTGLASSLAHAQALDATPVSPWYVGFGGHRADGTIPSESVNSIDALGTAFFGSTSTLRNVDERFAGWKVYLGYEWNPRIAVEFGGTSMGTTTVGYDFMDPTFNSLGSVVMDYNLSAIYIDAVGNFPLGQQWKLLGRVGASVSRTRVEFASDTIAFVISSNDSTETDTQLHFGAGVQYDFTPNVALRVEYERWLLPDPLSSDEVEVGSLGASIQMRF
jgi:opacity protein-like surface antigen